MFEYNYMDYSLVTLGGNVCKSLELSRQSDFIFFLLTIYSFLHFNVLRLNTLM